MFNHFYDVGIVIGQAVPIALGNDTLRFHLPCIGDSQVINASISPTGGQVLRGDRQLALAGLLPKVISATDAARIDSAYEFLVPVAAPH